MVPGRPASGIAAPVAGCVIVGSLDDPHVEAIASRIENALIVDATTLSDGRVAVGLDGPLVKAGGEWRSASPTRGWLRRLTPPAWTVGVEAHTDAARDRAAWLSMLVSFVRINDAAWLTGLDELIRAENKLIQGRAAHCAGVPTPDTVVAPTPQAAAAILGTSDLVAKPVGSSSFVTAQDLRSIPTTAIEMFTSQHFSPQAFLYQVRVPAQRHLRIVTVVDRAWVFAREVLDGDSLDWRLDASAHAEFEPIIDDERGERALRVAAALQINYSSQDWIDDGSETWLVDVNPAGQWLFLNGQARDQITDALARWLRDEVG